MRSKIFQEILDKTPVDVEIYVRLYADLVVRINQILREKGYTQKSLAEKLDKKPSEISKWLSGEHNFTLRSIAKLQAELGEPLLEVPKRKTQPEYIEGYTQKLNTFVSNRKGELLNTNKVIKWQQATGINPLSDVGQQ